MTSKNPDDTAYFAGYFFVKRIPRPEYMRADLLPPFLFSLSTCLNETLPHLWTFAWIDDVGGDKREAGQAFGLSEPEQAELTAVCTAFFETGHVAWTHVITDLATAQFLSRWVKCPPGEVKLLMLGLHAAERETFLKEEGQSPQEDGVTLCLRRQEPITGPRKMLGYEILGFEFGSFHSWLCNSIENQAWDRLGIRPNADGFLNSYADALKVCALINEPDFGAEPVLWLPWQVSEISF
ncbi:MAG: hypothetical protein ACO1RX_23655 [Candidatus Sericytochromatia bacterium]